MKQIFSAVGQGCGGRCDSILWGPWQNMAALQASVKTKISNTVHLSHLFASNYVASISHGAHKVGNDSHTDKSRSSPPLKWAF